MKERKSWFKKGNKHPLWKGENVSYRALHYWVVRELGKAKKCENSECVYPRLVNKRIRKKPISFEWANISHEYKRDLNDWMQLCQPCHNQYDMTPKKLLSLQKRSQKMRQIRKAKLVLNTRIEQII